MPSTEDDNQVPQRRAADRYMELRFKGIEDDVVKLEAGKASTESVTTIQAAIKDLKEEVAGLRRVLIVTALTWAIGTGTFLVAVLALAAKF